MDFGGSEIAIRGTSAVIDGERVEGTTKGGRQRTVSIDAGTPAVLQHQETQQANRCKAGASWYGGWYGGDYVFTTMVDCGLAAQDAGGQLLGDAVQEEGVKIASTR